MISPTIEQSPFLARAHTLHELGRNDALLDAIYDAVDELMRSGEFAELDAALAGADAAPPATDILPALLTSTLPVKSRLPSQARFFETVKRVVAEPGE